MVKENGIKFGYTCNEIMKDEGESVEMQDMAKDGEISRKAEESLSNDDVISPPRPPPRRKKGMSHYPKTVAFLPDEGNDSQGDSPEGVTSLPRHHSDDTECEDSGEPMFPGLYPVVFLRLNQTTVPRIWCLKIVANPWFERVSMFVILINCITLGLYEPCEHNTIHCESDRCKVLALCDHLVFAFFAVEMLIKMLAMGIWGKLGYLGEAWNRLDFFIVLCGMLEYTLQIDEMVNFTSVRTVRVLRPLRAINRVPSMRILVMLLLDTLPMLGNVLMLCSFVFFIFGVVAVQLWAGTLRQRCFPDPDMFRFDDQASAIFYKNFSTDLPAFYGQEESDDGNAQICSLPTFSGEFRCGDPSLVLPSQVDNVTCTLNASYYVSGQPTHQLLNDSYGNLNCINWNQYYNTCQAGDSNPFLGAISFDNILYAWVAIFQVISLEGWVDIMYFVMDGYSLYSFVYFILLIVIGSFFMINLCLVVIATQFSETKQREQRLMEEQRLRFKSNDSTLASYSPPGNCYEELLKYISHIYRKRKRRIKRWWRRRNQERQREKMKKLGDSSSALPTSCPKPTSGNRKKNRGPNPIHLHHHHHHHHHHYHIADSIERGERLVKVGVEIDLHDAPPFEPGASPLPGKLMLGDACSDKLDIPTVKNSFRLTLPRVSPTFNTSARSLPGSLTPESRHSVTPDRRTSGDLTITPAGTIYFSPAQETPRKKSGRVDGYLCSPVPDRQPSPKGSFYVRSASSSPSKRPTIITSDLNCSCSLYDPECFESKAEEVVFDDTVAPEKCCCVISVKSKWKKVCELWTEFRSNVRKVVESKYFNRGIMIAILINTMSMGIEHHNQPQSLTNVLEISNVVFATLFVLEMGAKLIAFGIVGYLKNLYNVFDAVIVIISVWEIAAGTQSGGGLSVLRTFRLLRVLKLVRFLPALRRQLVVLMRTMDNVATFMMLLTLFIFIFSILGMHLFGCEFCKLNSYGETECDRKNFDSLLWAFVTVFQILTQEDWNIVLYNGMAATRPAAAIYFITLMTIGNYVLFNLLVAILVEGFQAECYPERLQTDDEIDDDEDDSMKDVVLADEYTRKVAHALGLRQPLPTSRTMHRGDTESTASSLCSSDDEVGDDVAIVFNTSRKDSIKERSLSCSSCESSGTSDDDEESFGRDVPIITRTAATPLPTPTPLTSHTSLHIEEAGLDVERCKLLKGAEGGSIISIDRRRSDSSNGHPGTLSSDSRKSSVVSRLSVSSLRSSFRSKNRELPSDQQSLVSGMDECNEEYSEDDDAYSNSSFNMCPEGNFPDDVEKDEFLMERGAGNSGLSPSTSRRVKSCEHDHLPMNVFCRCCRAFTSCCAVERINKFATKRRAWSLYILSPESRLRKLLQRTVSNKWFDYVILLFIFGNCITIAMERPSLREGDNERFVIDVMNYIFTVVFTLELMLKVLANGLYCGDSTYLKSGWNVLDFILVVTSLIDVLMTLASSGGSKLFGILRVLRLLRALRPLRVISRAPGLKVVVQTLLSSLKPIGNIVLICCAFFIIFGILGVQVFKGKFYHCEGPDIRYVINRTQCVEDAENTWTNHRYNFDDLGQALMSLFVLSSKDGWVEIMYHGIDAVGVDQQPIENYNPWMLLYFISFLLIVGFFVLNMFVGVVVENFHRCREQHELEEIKRKEEIRKKKEERLLLKQSRQSSKGGKANFRKKTMSRARTGVDDCMGVVRRMWMRLTFNCCYRYYQKDDLKYHERYGKARRAIHSFCMSKYFEAGISLVIGINILTMATEHYQQPEELGIALKYANYVFTAVFVLEAILKLIALGICRYFADKWNQLDMLIVILSIVGIVIEDMGSAGDRSLFINPTIIRVMRVLRIARVLKLLKISKGIRSLLETVACALPQVGNLGMLFILLFFIFAALGVELFGTLTCDAEHPCDGLNRHASFHNFGIALLTLFRISTGDNWNGIMKDTLRETCDPSADCRENCCVSAIISPIYFVLFVMMAQFVLVNVVVAVLMKQLEDSRLESSSGGTDDDVFGNDVDDFDAMSDDDIEVCDKDDLHNDSDKLYDETDERDSLIGSARQLVVMHELQRGDDSNENSVDDKSSLSSISTGKSSTSQSTRSNSITSGNSMQELKVVQQLPDSPKTQLPRAPIIPTRRSTAPDIPTSNSLNPITPSPDRLSVPSKPRLTASRSLPLDSAAPHRGDLMLRRSYNNNHHPPLERRLSDYCTTCECCQGNGTQSISTDNKPLKGENKQHLLTVPRHQVAGEQNKSFPQLPLPSEKLKDNLFVSKSIQLPTNADSTSDVWLSFDGDRPD